MRFREAAHMDVQTAVRDGAKVLVSYSTGWERTMDSVRTTLVFEQKPDGWIGYAPEVTGAYVQGSTLDEVRAKLSEAVYLVTHTNNEQAYYAATGNAFP
jgi:predicted RNase H-like HicB family nuclease